MARPRTVRPPHLEYHRTRHGKRVWYFRFGRGKRIRLPEPYGSPEFKAAYEAALLDHLQAARNPARRTLSQLIDAFVTSPAWAAMAGESRKQFRYQYERMRERAGSAPLASISAGSIAEGRDQRAARPSDANKFVKAARRLFAFAVERGWMRTNPAKDVALMKPRNVEGFHAWTEDEVARFEQCWPVGTRERLALDLLLYTGVRRSDVVRLGPQHMKDGTLIIRTEKSVNSGRPVAVEIAILPPLAKSLAAAKTGDDSFLATARGTPFVKESFGTWFRNACKAAGVPGSAHGLRKIAAIRSAENGATELELNAMFGWSNGSRESATYVRNANRAKLSRRSSIKMLPTPIPHTD